MKKKRKNPAAVSLGRLGGRVKGKCKARTSEQARAAVMVRWNRVKHDSAYIKTEAEQKARIHIE
jgi:hypothetical protein